MQSFRKTQFAAGKEPHSKFIGFCFLKEDDVTVQHLSTDAPNTASNGADSVMYIISMQRVFLMLQAEVVQQQVEYQAGVKFSQRNLGHRPPAKSLVGRS